MEATNTLGVLGGLDPAVAVVTAAVGLIASVVLYALFVLKPLPPDQRGMRAFANFDRCVAAPLLKFCYLLLAVLCLAFGLVGAVSVAVGRIPSGAGDAALGALGVLGVLVVVEIALRVLFELLMLPLRLADDVRSLRDAVRAGASAAPAEAEGPAMRADPGRSPDAFNSVPPQPSDGASGDDPSDGSVGVPVARRAPALSQGDLPAEACGREISLDDASSWGSLEDAGEEPVSGGAPVDGRRGLWDCRCGAAGNAGAYCGTCGAPRESALRTY